MHGRVLTIGVLVEVVAVELDERVAVALPPINMSESVSVAVAVEFPVWEPVIVALLADVGTPPVDKVMVEE